jgi:hypothetical protein
MSMNIKLNYYEINVNVIVFNISYTYTEYLYKRAFI